MKLPMVCMQCAFPTNGEAPDSTLYSLPVREDSVYEFTCPRGHQAVTVIQEEKFEILFEIAINAIVDGYYRDAVASATSSLERFYEFLVRVICHAHEVPIEEFGKAWKSVAKQSERQLGMFLAAHILHFKKAPELNGDQASFRNDVIHKGLIPTKDQAIKYTNDILGLIRPLLIEVKTSLNESVQALAMVRLKERQSRLGETPRASMVIGSTVSLTLSVTEPHPTSIELSLKRIEERKAEVSKRAK